MTGTPTLDPEKESLNTLRNYWLFSSACVQSDPYAAPFAPKFVAFGPLWDTFKQKETSLRDAVIKAEAVAIIADRVLNELADQVAAVIHGGKQANLKLPSHRLYFGADAPHILKRPILGTQLERMRSWPELLSEESQASLKSLATPVSTAVAAADKAEAALHHAQVENNRFRLGGERNQIFDAWTSLCATTYGGLRAFVHDHPELKLGAEYADSFFRHVPKSQGPKTLAQAAEHLQKLQQEVARGQKAYDELLSKQQAEAKEAKEQAEADAAAAEANEAAAKAIAKAKAAKALAKKAKR